MKNRKNRSKVPDEARIGKKRRVKDWRPYKVCGAISRMTKKPCQSTGLYPNGRCYWHGGRNRGAPKGNIHREEVGIYSQYFTDEENDFLKQTELGKLDGELEVLRVRLRRLVIAARDIDSGKLTLELGGIAVEQVEENSSGTGGGDAGEFTKNLIKTVRRLPDVDSLIDRYTGRIANLERTRAELLGKIGGDTKTVIVIEGGLPDDDATEG